MKTDTFVVVAYRYGARAGESYLVGCYSDVKEAIIMADNHVPYRGRKYGCAVFKAELDSVSHRQQDRPKEVYYTECPLKDNPDQ